jgi:membrane protein YdbS with pleckstrin-like domain
MLPNQEPHEEVVIFLRRHWIDFLKIVLYTGLLIALPLMLVIILNILQVDILANPVLRPLLAIILPAYALIVFTITITEITDYWLDTWIVTTERIIDINQSGLFKRLVSEVHLHQIQDITSETSGFLETFLTFGDVYIQTAGTKERFQFININNPNDVKVKISELVKNCKGKHGHGHAVAAPAPEKM